MEPAAQPREYVAFDLETTGLAAREDQIVEVAGVRFAPEGRLLDQFSRLVNPGRPMPAAARSITGISDDDLVGAPAANEVLPEFIAFLADPGDTALVAHHACLDAGFLGQELCRTGLELPRHRVFDTLALARRRRPDLPRHRVVDLAHAYGIGRPVCHRALEDALCVKEIWLALGGPSAPAEILFSYPIHDPRDAIPPPHGWSDLVEAIASGLAVEIAYEGGTRGLAPRKITPRRFVQKGGEPYLVAVCHLDQREKSFRLQRIQHRIIGGSLRVGDCDVDPRPVSR